MEFHEKLRVIAGILCIFIAFLRVVQFFFDPTGAVVYSAIFVPWGESVGFIEGIAVALMAFIFSILATGFAFLVYIILGALVIAGRRLKFVTIVCNIITAISIILSIRAIAIYASLGQVNIFTIFFLIIYIVIFSICLLSYIKIRKEG
ncbi:MAG: hypothetical protein ACFE9N_17150 [Promethearchaeota archaeon]